MQRSAIESALQATGEQLAASGHAASIVVVGGASLAVLNLVRRTTDDVDVIALADRLADGTISLRTAVPLPHPVTQAAARVARDLGLPIDWLNAEVGAQFAAGLPPSLAADITWRRYAALEVGFVGREALIALKLFATVDQSPASVHAQDLAALTPTLEELQVAAEWVATQDASPGFPSRIAEVIAHVQRRHR